MDGQMKKGALELCILSLLSQDAFYGYEIARRVNEFFPEVSESTCYAILRRLHSDGSAQVFRGQESGGPTRKYYQLTPAGMEKLKAAKAEWTRIAQAVEVLCP